MPVLEFPDLGLIDVPEGADIGKAAEAAKRFVRTTKTSSSPQPMTSAQMNVQAAKPAQPMQAVDSVPASTTPNWGIPQDAGLQAQTTMDQLRQYRDTMGRLIAPALGMDYDQMSADQAKGILRQVIAFHGSPHTFDQFDASKIGTGEGAQAYGHGLYFAENPAVAGEYAEQGVNRSMRRVPRYQGDTEGKLVPTASPNIYNVTIPDEHAARMLDWDKPVSQSLTPDQIRRIRFKLGEDFVSRAEDAANAPLDQMNGGELHNALYRYASETPLHSGELDLKPDVAKYLESLGVPGIKYLDQGSRTAGQGTRNFVVFDPAILQDVTRK